MILPRMLQVMDVASCRLIVVASCFCCKLMGIADFINKPQPATCNLQPEE